MIRHPINDMVAILEYWNKFQQFEFADELLIILGAFLVLVGIIKIVRSSIKMLFWVLLSGMGAISVAYGMNQSNVHLPGTEGMQLNELIGHGKELSMDVRQVLCNQWLSLVSDEQGS